MVEFNVEFNNKALEEGVYLISDIIRPDFSTKQVKEQIECLAAIAKEAVASVQGHEQRLTLLIDLFYRQWGFGSSRGVYNLSDAMWLDNVLNTRQGTPVALGVIFMQIATQLDIPLQPVIFPTQLLLRTDWISNQSWGINPQNGERLTLAQLELWIKGHFGPLSKLDSQDLELAENNHVIYKLLETLKDALMQENKPELALRANQIMISFNPEDPYEIRDRGLIYAQLGCDHIALADLNYFIEQCPEDPISEVVKMQILSIDQQDIVLH